MTVAHDGGDDGLFIFLFFLFLLAFFFFLVRLAFWWELWFSVGGIREDERPKVGFWRRKVAEAGFERGGNGRNLIPDNGLPVSVDFSENGSGMTKMAESG